MVFFLALLLSLVFLRVGIPLAKGLKLVDSPDGERKLHREPIPLIGGLVLVAVAGLALFLMQGIESTNSIWAFMVCMALLVAYRDWETDRKGTRLNSSH